MLAAKCVVRGGERSGFSLVELLISLLLGSLLLTMVIGLYVTGVSTGASSLQYSRLRTDLQSIMAMLESDIRRAGYSGGLDHYLVGINGDKSVDINDGKNCIVYYYNHDHSKTIDSSNKMAFSLKDNAVKFKSGVVPVANNACAEVSGWRDISDAGFVKISTLSFNESILSSATVTLRSVEIELVGELVSDHHYSHSVSTRVQVRNAEFAY